MKRPLIAFVVVAWCVAIALALLNRPAPDPTGSSTPATPSPVEQQRVAAVAGTVSTDSDTRPVDPIRLTTTRGRPLDIDGSKVATFLARVAPAARTGDARAAYRVYQAEATCASIGRYPRTPSSSDEAEARAYDAYLATLNDACVGVSPAQMSERFAFLDQAIRAGNEQAMIDYRAEGPNGMRIEQFDPRDPLLMLWKSNANAYLEQLAAKGQQDAWALLAQDYENGVVIVRDPRASLTYWTALQVSRKPGVDPLSVGFIDDLAKQLSAADAQDAIAKGRALGTQFPRARRAA